MTNEISINWNKNQSAEEPIFEMFDDSEFESIQQDAMALYGEACYVQESYEEYILEATDEPGIATNVVRLVKNLIGRFIRAIGRFMSNLTCKKAVAFFNDPARRTEVKSYMKTAWPLKKGDPGYTLLVAVLRMKLILKHVDAYEFIMKTPSDESEEHIRAKLGEMNLGVADTGHFVITGVTREKAIRIIDKMFGRDGIDNSGKTLKDIIHMLEGFNTFWSPYDKDGKNSVVVKMVTTDIKAFAQFQSELLEAYRFFSTVEKDSVLKGLHENNKKLSDIKDQVHEMNEKADKSVNKTEKDIPIDYKK